MEARLAKSVGLNFDGFALDNFFFGWERERDCYEHLYCVVQPNVMYDELWSAPIIYQKKKIWSAPCLLSYLYFSFPVDISDVKSLRFIFLYCLLLLFKLLNSAKAFSC